VGDPIHARIATAPPAMRSGTPSTSLVPVHVVTQQPFGERTQIHTLVANWSHVPVKVHSSRYMTLPRAPVPSDGGADVFLSTSGKLFATDRYGGNGCADFLRSLTSFQPQALEHHQPAGRLRVHLSLHFALAPWQASVRALSLGARQPEHRPQR
jgi:hypothetical protein